jgi:hypothetical protein
VWVNGSVFLESNERKSGRKSELQFPVFHEPSPACLGVGIFEASKSESFKNISIMMCYLLYLILIKVVEDVSMVDGNRYF